MFDRHTHIVWGGIVALMLLLAGAGAAQDALHDQELNASIIAQLHDTIVDVAYDGEDLEDVFDGLRDTHTLNIHVSWKRLEQAGVRKDDRIELKLRKVPLAQVLEMILRESSDDFDELGYSVRNGIVIVSSREDLDRDTVLKTYDITDLIESGYSIRRFANTPVLGLQLTGREHIGGEKRATTSRPGGGGSGGGIFGEPDDDSDRLSVMERLDEIVNILQDHIDPDSWRDLGGETGSIMAHDSVLLIKHTIDAHRRIEALLELLRQVKPTPLDADAIVVHLRADRAARWRESFADSFPRLSDQQIDRLIADDDAEDVLFRASTTGHNGKRLWLSALTQRELLAGFTPTISTHSAAFAPVTAVATEGLELIVLPLLNPDGHGLSLDVQMAWIPPSVIEQRPVSLDGGEENATIDRVSRIMRTVSSRVTLGLDQAIALTIPQAVEHQGQAAEFEDWLIVRVKRSQ